MFTRIKVVTSLIMVLVIFGTLQLASGGLFINALTHDKNSFAVSQAASDNVALFTDAWVTLNQTRITLNRGMLRLQSEAANSGSSASLKMLSDQAKQQLALAAKTYAAYQALPETPGMDSQLVERLEQSYDVYVQTLTQMIQLMDDKQLDAMFKMNIEAKQKVMQSTYVQWRDQQAMLSKQGAAQNEKAYEQMLWLISGVMVLVVALIVLCWYGLRNILIRPLQSSIAHIRTIAEGDLTQNIVAVGRNEMAQLANSLHEMQQALVKTVSVVRDGSDAIYTGASEISAGNNDLSARTEEQAASLEQTAASMEQLTATVKQNAENARQASQLALNASETAQKGGRVVDGVVKTMNDIAGSSKKIADIISVIDGIAFQTNILALARVDTGSQLVGSAGETMTDIVNAVTRVTDIMGEIASASDEQSRGIDQVGTAVTEMDRVTQQNASLVEESASAAASLEDQASRLTQAVAVFRIARQQAAPAAVLKRPLLNKPSAKPANPVSNDGHWETF
ncbi:chemotaxis protein [bacteria symbiont BFo1 of Frankliniella occidentalis]|nr:chemotaxis protein [bacteria symbiont BFo1 of Frankliniella occidentalis]